MEEMDTAAATARPLSNHCLPLSLFSLVVVSAESGINLKVKENQLVLGAKAEKETEGIIDIRFSVKSSKIF